MDSNVTRRSFMKRWGDGGTLTLIIYESPSG